MKIIRYILTALMLFSAILLRAEWLRQDYVAMLQEGNEWNYYRVSYDTHNYIRYFIDGTEESDGRLYWRVWMERKYKDFIWDEDRPLEEDPKKLVALMREDNGRVYVKYKEPCYCIISDTDSEHLMYDFTVNEGDVCQNYKTSDKSRYRVREIKTLYVNGVTLRAFFLAEDIFEDGEWKESNPDAFAYAEGIGPLPSPHGGGYGTLIEPLPFSPNVVSVTAGRMTMTKINKGDSEIEYWQIEDALTKDHEYVPMLQEGNEWNYGHISYDTGTCNYTRYFLDGTEESEGHLYWRIWEERKHRDKEGRPLDEDSKKLIALMREDSGRVYIKYKEPCRSVIPVDTEHLLYDFTVKEGDVCQNYKTSDKFRYRVRDIKTLYVNGTELRTFFLAKDLAEKGGWTEIDSDAFIYAEGIGPLSIYGACGTLIEPRPLSPVGVYGRMNMVKIKKGDVEIEYEQIEDALTDHKYLPMLDGRMEWQTSKRIHLDYNPTYHIYSIDGEKEINGNIYKMMWIKNADYKSDNKPSLHAYLREEAGKVYRMTPGYESMDNPQEELIYDFTVKVGDEIPAQHGIYEDQKYQLETVSNRVVEIGRADYDDDIGRRKIRVHYIFRQKNVSEGEPATFEGDYVYVEGIGSYTGSPAYPHEEWIFRTLDGAVPEWSVSLRKDGDHILRLCEIVGGKEQLAGKESGGSHKSARFGFTPDADCGKQYPHEYVPICQEGNEWTYRYHGNYFEKTRYSHYRIEGTEDVDGRTYHRLWYSDPDFKYQEPVIAALMREENGKVYSIRKMKAPDDLSWGGELDKEYLIYDFNLDPGASYPVFPLDDKYGGGSHSGLGDDVNYVRRVKTIDLFGKTRNAMKVMTDGNPPYLHNGAIYPFSCVEGIGTVYFGSVAFPYNDGIWPWECDGTYPEILVSAKLDGGNVVVPSWEQLNRMIEDALTGIGRVEADNAGVVIKVSAGAILVEGLSDDAQVAVYDVAGRCVYAGHDNVVTGLLPGVYIVRAAGQSAKVIL